MALVTPRMPPRVPSRSDEAEALIEEARARQRLRRLRFALLVVLTVALGASAYGVDRTISNGPAAPACLPQACTVAAANDPNGDAKVPLYGLYRGSPRRISLGPHSYTSVETATLVQVDPKTLAPVGKHLRFTDDFFPRALSPNGAQLLGTNSSSKNLTLVDLKQMRVNAAVDARIDRELGQRTVTAISWLSANRVVAVVQAYTKPYARSVASRSLIAFDARTGEVVWTHTLTHKLALFGVRAVGDKLVLELVDSRLKRTGVTLLIASANGQLRFGHLNIPRVNAPYQAATLVAIPGPSPAVYLVSGNDTVFSVDLTTGQTTPHIVEPPANAPSTAPSKYEGLFPIAAALGGKIVATGLFTSRDGKPRGGIYLIDPAAWNARLIDRDTPSFTSNGAVLAISNTAPLGLEPGNGVTLYNQTGTPIRHLYGASALQGISLTPTFGYAFAPTDNTPNQHRMLPINSGGQLLVFDPATGQRLGHTAPTTGNAPQLIYPGAPALDFSR